MTLRWGRALALLATLTLASLAVALVSAPAAYVDLALREASGGRVRVADAAGTVWHGEGRLVLMEGADGISGFAIPGALQWDVRALPLLAGLVDASIALPGMARPVRINGGVGEWRIEPGSIDLPVTQLSRLGSPWNTIQPAAALVVKWESLTFRSSGLDGRLFLELRDVVSAMTPVRPLGSYRADVTATGRQAEVRLSTLSGALQLQGQGSWERQRGLRLQAQAWGEGEDRARLQALLGLIGRREGERTIIRIGG